VEWKTSEGTRDWYERYILGTKDQLEMLTLAAEEEDMHTLEYVKELENLACDSAFCSLGTWGVGGDREWKYEEVAKRAI
jgi:hypothetical protein